MVTPPETSGRMGGRPVQRIAFSADEIAARVAVMGRQITDYYPRGQKLLVLGLLKGSFIFLADLVREIDMPLQVDFIMVSSYGNGTVSTGDVRLVYDPEADLSGKHVLLVEDIIDSGNTLNRLIPLLEKRQPLSLELCALLHKRISPPLAREARWVGFDAPPEFLVGYGLDHAENFRHLPYIASL